MTAETKNKTKLIKKAFLILSLAFLLSVPVLAYAQEGGLVDSLAQGQICSPDNSSFGSATNLARCANNIYIFAIAFGGFYAVLMFVIAGYMYSFGSADSIKKAKDIMRSTVVGLILLFGVYAILNTIDPGLTTFENIVLEQIHCNGDACRIPDFVWDGPPVPEGAAANVGNCLISFRSSEVAATYMDTITVNIWRMGANDTRVPGTVNVRVQRCVRDKVKAAFDAIYASPEKVPIYRNSQGLELGGFEWRYIANSRTLSNHSYGLAVDINWSYNGVYYNGRHSTHGVWRPCPGANCSPYSFTANGSVVRAFKGQSFGWGGEWRRSKLDYMHFSCMPREGGDCSR
jgi:hypothetical protein